MVDVIGAIRDKWLALGGTGGVLGQPLDLQRHNSAVLDIGLEEGSQPSTAVQDGP